MKIFLPALYILVIALLNSCEVAEPDRFYNKEPEKPVSGTLNAVSFDSSKVYTKEEMVKFHIDSLNFEIKQVILLIDDNQVYHLDFLDSMIYFNINPHYFHDGSHKIIFSIVAKNKGLLSLNNVGVLYFKSSFISYSGDSLKSEINSITMGDKPTVHWSLCNDIFFQSYKVVRTLNGKNDTVAVISDPNTTSFTDLTYPDIFGKSTASYRIITTGKYGKFVSKYFDLDNLSIFDVLPYKEKIYSRTFLPCNNGNLIFSSGKDYYLKYVDLSAGNVISTLNCTVQASMKFNSKQNKIISQADYTVGSLDITDFSDAVSNMKQYNMNKSFLTGLTYQEVYPELLLLSYALGYSPNQKLYFGLFDLNSCTLVKEFTIDKLAIWGRLMTTDKNGIAYWINPSDNLIYKIDAADTSNIKTSSIGNKTNFHNLISVGSGRFYLERDHEISICDQNLNQLIVKTVAPIFFDSWINGNTLVLNTKDGDDNRFVEVYDLQSLNLVKRFAVNFDVQNIIVFPDGKIILNVPVPYSTDVLYYKLK